MTDAVMVRWGRTANLARAVTLTDRCKTIFDGPSSASRGASTMTVPAIVNFA